MRREEYLVLNTLRLTDGGDGVCVMNVVKEWLSNFKSRLQSGRVICMMQPGGQP